MPRFFGLDIIRGYAALAVLIAHTTIVGIYNNPDIWPILVWSPLRFLWGGHQAVIAFFVLSGFALTKMIESMPIYSYHKYVIARIIRLYIPFLFSIFFVFTSFLILHYFNYMWNPGWMNVVSPDFNMDILIPHLYMVGVYNYFAINPPIWTLVYEARLSILFPIILYLINRFDFKALIFFFLLSFLCSLYLYIQKNTSDHSLIGTSILTLHYALFFTMGCFLSKRVDILKKRVLLLEKKYIFSLLILSLFLYSYPFNNPWSLYQRTLGDIIIGVGAMGLITLSFLIKQGIFYQVGLYLGKISFSLYLTHFTVLSVLLITLYEKLGSLYIWILTIIISIFVAHYVTILIDKPSIKLSKIFLKGN